MFSIDLSGKRAWVTGASRGIGRATAVMLAQAGCDVAVGYRGSEPEARAVADEVTAHGRKAHLAQGHVGSAEDCERMHRETVAALGGPIDILINNAGVTRDAMFLTMEDAQFREVIETNLMGTVHTTRCVLHSMWARKQGRIVNVSSVSAHGGARGQTNYAASKGAIESMTKNLAREVAARGITVNCVSPGVIDTDMWAGLDPKPLLERQLIKRLGKPSEVAAWIVMLCSEWGSFITGEVLPVDGGL